MIRRTATGTSGFMLRYTAAQDPRLSYRARGVLAAVLSRPQDWRTSAEQLAQEGTEGRDAIRAALDELVAAGYLRRERYRSSGGRVWGYEWDISDTPQVTPTVGFPTSVDQPSVNQPSAVQRPVNQRPVNRRPVNQPSVNQPSAGQAYEREERDRGETPPPTPARPSRDPAVDELVVVVRRSLPRTTPPPGLPTLRKVCGLAAAAGWTPATIEREMRGHDWTGARSGAVVAFLRDDVAERTPQESREDGQERPEWCGGCDGTSRLVEDEQTGAQRRCPRCHPLAGVPTARRRDEHDDGATLVGLAQGVALLRAGRVSA